MVQCFILSEGGIYIYFMSTCKYQLPRMLTYDTRNGGTSHFTHILYHQFNAFRKWWLWCLGKTMLLAVYSHFVDTLIFIFFHLFHSFSLAINYLYITCKGFHYRRKFARNDYILAGLKTFLYSHNMNQRLVYNVTIHFSKIIKLTKIYCVDE